MGQLKHSAAQEHLLCLFCVFLQNLFFSLVHVRRIGGLAAKGPSLGQEPSHTFPWQLCQPPLPRRLCRREPWGRSPLLPSLLPAPGHRAADGNAGVADALPRAAQLRAAPRSLPLRLPCPPRRLGSRHALSRMFGSSGFDVRINEN